MVKIVTKRKELSEPCEEVSLDEGLEIADQLLEVLDERKDGIGLAANQIGIKKRVCVTAIPQKEEDGTSQTWVRKFINPVVVKKEEPVIFDGEGCLSFLTKKLKTIRYTKCNVIDTLNPDGLELSGLEAICVQHEIDHLNGITMFERRYKSFSPNSKCPCDSGKKFKKCCMITLVETSEPGNHMRTLSTDQMV